MFKDFHVPMGISNCGHRCSEFSNQRVFQPASFPTTDGVRDLVEDIVVEGVSADEVTEGREGRKFFLDVVFDLEHIGSVQGAEHDGDMPEQLLASQ